MFLNVCATPNEMQPFASALRDDSEGYMLVAGVGPVETALAVSRFLQDKGNEVSGVINFGVCGAYLDCGADLLDICLAENEVFGDFGIASGDSILPFESARISGHGLLHLDKDLLRMAAFFLDKTDIGWKSGNFVTVSSVSGTKNRGIFLQQHHQALCENMEGASVVRVCRDFALPCLEIRCISNMVDNRDIASWKLQEACEKAGRTAAFLSRALSGQSVNSD